MNPLTVTRESRNVELIEDGVEAVSRELNHVADLYRQVFPHLPDGFPLLQDELAEARNAVDGLRTAVSA